MRVFMSLLSPAQATTHSRGRHPPEAHHLPHRHPPEHLCLHLQQLHARQPVYLRPTPPLPSMTVDVCVCVGLRCQPAGCVCVCAAAMPVERARAISCFQKPSKARRDRVSFGGHAVHMPMGYGATWSSTSRSAGLTCTRHTQQPCLDTSSSARAVWGVRVLRMRVFMCLHSPAQAATHSVYWFGRDS